MIMLPSSVRIFLCTQMLKDRHDVRRESTVTALVSLGLQP